MAAGLEAYVRTEWNAVLPFKEGDPNEEFELIETIGEGFSNVWLARTKDGDHFAIRRYEMEFPDDAGVLDELLSEMRAIAQSNHDHIAKYYSCHVHKNELWVVMEYFEEGCLLELLKEGPFEEEEIKYVIHHVLSVLEYLHKKGAYHGNIRANNIRLKDKGFMKLDKMSISQPPGVRGSSLMGVPHWMAPEVITGDGFDSTADIWALGITAIELAEGAPPLGDQHPMRVLFMIPKKDPPTLTKDPTTFSDDFHDFLTKCLVKDKEKRWTAKELKGHPWMKGANWDSGTPSLLMGPIDRKTWGMMKGAGVKRAKKK